MLLDNFSYYFSVKGREGGIFSLTFEFLPDVAAADQNVDSIRQIIKDDFAMLESRLETLLFSDLRVQVKKKPVLTDSPHSLQAGYEYEGKGKTRVVNLGDLLKKLFPIGAGLSQNPGIGPTPIDPFTHITAHLSYSLAKKSVDGKFAVIILELKLGHELNLSMLNSVQNLPKLRFSEKAQIEVQHLQRVLDLGEDINPLKQLESSLKD